MTEWAGIHPLLNPVYMVHEAMSPIKHLYSADKDWDSIVLGTEQCMSKPQPSDLGKLAA